MLAGQAQQLETCVYKSETVSDLWGDYPVVFRLFLLPVVLYAVYQQCSEEQDFVLLNLGTTGEELDLMNEHLAHSPDDSREMRMVAYAAENVYPVTSSDSPVRQTVMSALILLQTAVWCVQGEGIVLVGLGNNGGELPEWAWEYVRQGPQITNVRLKSFDSAGPSDGDGGGPPTGRPDGRDK